MSINLQKGQKIDLTKGNSDLTGIMVGLGWDPVGNAASSPSPEERSGGKFRKLFGGGASKPQNIDCDASVIMLNSDGKLPHKDNVVYFGNKQSPDRSIKHMGDNLTGAGEGDDEQIFVDLMAVPTDIHRLVFVVNIYDCQRRKQDFGLIQNAFIRVVNNSNNQELLRFNLTENYAGMTALIVGEVYRHQSEWKFNALGQATQDISINQMTQRYT